MSLTVSFVSLVSTIVAVCVSAIIMMLATEDLCPETSRRCEEDGKCIANRRFCNTVKDCPNGSDEDMFHCTDLTGVGEYFKRYMDHDARVVVHRYLRTSCMSEPALERARIADQISLANISILITGSDPTIGPNETTTTRKPTKYEPLYYPKGCFQHRDGVFCKKTNWTELPWDQFDNQSKALNMVSVLRDNEELNVQPRNQILAVRYMFLEENHIKSFPDGSFCHLPCLLQLHLRNNSLETIGHNAFCEHLALITLDLSHNKLTLKGYRFKGMSSLEDLHLHQNQITELSDHVFREIPNLRLVNLRENCITTIGSRTFRYNMFLTDLYLSSNHLHSFAPRTFSGNYHLQVLTIGHNHFKRLPIDAFRDVQKSIKSLYLEGIEVVPNDVFVFQKLKNLDFVYFDKFAYCRYVPHVSRCFPDSDGFSNLEDLLIGRVIRVIVWTIGFTSILGNLSILFTRTLAGRGRSNVLDVFIKNLAMADFLMGVYLITLGIKDLEYRNSYLLYAYSWTTSNVCAIIGITAMISSEVSLLILTLMSVERYIAISRPFSHELRLRKTQARLVCTVVWIFVIIISMIPVFTTKNPGTYFGSSGLCFPAHLEDFGNGAGWQYTSLVFIGLNSLCLIVITVAYIMLFCEVRKSTALCPDHARDMEMGLRLSFTVATDICCWLPIIILKIMVNNGFELDNETISWLLLCVMPMNSTINPFLYTMSTSDARLKLLTYFKSFPCPFSCPFGRNKEKEPTNSDPTPTATARSSQL